MKIDAEKNFWSNLSEQLKTLIGAALGLVAGLAWNDAISSSIKMIFPENTTSSLILKIIYAVTVTIFIVILVFYMNHIEYVVRHRVQSRHKKHSDKK